MRLRREFHRLIVRPATADDRQAWAAMRALLWTEEGAAGHAAELAALAGDPQFAGFVADDEGLLIGFAEATVRSYAEGCGDEPAAYLEGIWVAPGHRRKGVGRALLEAVETWGRARGHRWLGSDALLDNRASHAWHGAAGFDEVERVVVYRKPIGGTG